MDDWTSSQPVFIGFCSTTSLASSFAFDSYDALLFHVPTWFSPYGDTWIGFNSYSSRQQTILNFRYRLKLSCIPSSQRGMPHHVPSLRTPVDNCIIFTLNNQKKTVTNIHILLAQRDFEIMSSLSTARWLTPNRNYYYTRTQINDSILFLQIIPFPFIYFSEKLTENVKKGIVITTFCHLQSWR